MDVPPPLDAEETNEAASVAEIFERIDPIILGVAPTGSGKTYQECAASLDRHRKGKRTMLIVQDKEAMAQVRRYLLSQWESAGGLLTDLKVQLVDANEEQDTDEESTGPSGGSKIHASTLIVVTHHHFASRKPLTRILYSVIRWIQDKSVLVVIDEFDLYVDRQNLGFDLDARYHHIGGGFRPWEKLTNCMTRGGSFNCKKCVKRSQGSLISRSTHLEFSLPKIIPTAEFHDNRANEFTIPTSAYTINSSVFIPEMQLTLSSLTQHSDVLPYRNWEATSKDAKDAQQLFRPEVKYMTDYYLDDLIQCAHRPTHLQFAPVDMTAKPPQQTAGDPQELAKAEKSTFTSDSTLNLSFPYPTCSVRTLVLYDRAPLYYIMQNAERFIGITATMTSWAREFADACAADQSITIIEVNQPERKPLTSVIMVGLQSGINFTDGLSKTDARRFGTEELPSSRTTLEHVGQAVMASGKKLLTFFPTKTRSEHIFSKVKEHGWRFFREGKRILTSPHDHIANDAYAEISYSRSVIGIGANLKHFEAVVVDGFVAKPHHVYMPEKSDHLAYLREQELDRTRVIQQNIGRILRSDDPSTMKYIFVCGVNPAQFDHLAKEIAKVTQQPPTCKLYKKDDLLALEAFTDAIRTGILPNLYESVEGDEAPAKRKPHTIRRKKSESERRIELHEVIARHAGSGQSWSLASRAINGSRLDKSLLNDLRECFDELTSADEDLVARELLSLLYMGNTKPPEPDDVRLRILAAWTSERSSMATSGAGPAP